MTSAEPMIGDSDDQGVDDQGVDDPGVDDQGGRRLGSDATLERLRAKILSGELPPGSIVSQTALARTLGVSTTPLREVIRQLQAEGLLEVELNRRPRVAPLDIDDMIGVYAGRIMVESLGALVVVPMMSEQDAADMRADLAAMRSLHAKGEEEEWAAVHGRFHRRLVGAGPPAISAILTNLADRTERYRRLAGNTAPRSPVEADAEHERLVESCEERDGRRASVELANHLARTALSLSASFAPHFDPRPVRLAVGMITCSLPAVETPAPRRRRR